MAHIFRPGMMQDSHRRVKQTPEETVTKGKSWILWMTLTCFNTLPPSPPLSRNESWPMLAIDLESLGSALPFWCM